MLFRVRDCFGREPRRPFRARYVRNAGGFCPPEDPRSRGAAGGILDSTKGSEEAHGENHGANSGLI